MLQTCYAPVFILIVLFAISSWIAFNVLYSEMPLLLEYLPEHWKLMSYVLIVLQIGNGSIVVWSIIRHFYQPRETVVIYCMLSVSFVGVVFLGIFWHRTVVVGGNDHSVPVLVLTLILASVGSLSNVVFQPFVAHFNSAIYINAYQLGNNIGNLIPAVVGLIQRAGGDSAAGGNYTNYTTDESNSDADHPHPLFSVAVFCAIVCVTIAVSAAAFTALICVKRCRQEMSPHHIQTTGLNSGENSETRYQSVSQCNHSCTTDDSTSIVKIAATGRLAACLASVPVRYIRHLAMLFIICGLLNSFVPAVQSYSSLPYGHTTYALVNELSAIAGPVACLVALRWTTSSLLMMTLITVVGMALSAYQIGLAKMSPNPVLKDTAIGQALVVGLITVYI